MAHLSLHLLLHLSSAQATLAASSGVHAACVQIFLHGVLDDPLFMQLGWQNQRDVVEELLLSLRIGLLRNRIERKRLANAFVVLVGVVVLASWLIELAALVALQVVKVVHLGYLLFVVQGGSLLAGQGRVIHRVIILRLCCRFGSLDVHALLVAGSRLSPLDAFLFLPSLLPAVAHSAILLP